MSNPMRIRYAIVLAGLVLVLWPLVTWAAVELARFEGWWENDRVVLEWETGSEINHAGFNLYRYPEDLPPAQVRTQATKLNEAIIFKETACTTSGNAYRFEDTSADPAESRYHYWLESINCTGGSEIDSDAHIVVTGQTPPAPPATVTAIGVSESGAIRVLWTAVAEADGYRVERRSGAAEWAQLGEVGSSQLFFNDAGATCSVTWEYRVRTLANSIASEPSAVVSQLAPPCAPHDLYVTLSGTSVRLTWTDSAPDETGYRVERRQSGSWVLVSDSVPANSTSYADGDAPCGMTIRYRIRALRSTDNLMSPWRASGWVDSLACTPTAAPTVTNTPEPTATSLPTETPTRTGTPTVTLTSTRTMIPGPAATRTRRPTSTRRPTRIPRPTVTVTASVSPTPSVGQTPGPSPTKMQTTTPLTSITSTTNLPPTPESSVTVQAAFIIETSEPPPMSEPTPTPPLVLLEPAEPAAPPASLTEAAPPAWQTPVVNAERAGREIAAPGASDVAWGQPADRVNLAVGGVLALITLLIAGWLYSALRKGGV